MSVMAKKPSQNHTKLLAAARDLFVQNGFSKTGTEEIVAWVCIIRGALYHQFSDKKDLFEALFVSVLDEVAVELFE